MALLKFTKTLSCCDLLIMSENSHATDWGGLIERVATQVDALVNLFKAQQSIEGFTNSCCTRESK